MSLPEVRSPAARVRWESQLLPAAGHQVYVRTFDPGSDTAPWLVWAHGGSWRAGSVDGWHQACADLARHAGTTVVSVDYRLAPGHRHPAALLDVLTALDWAERRSGRPAAVGGDSAGGTLAACAALVRRDAGRQAAAQVLAYPPVDPDCRAASYGRHPGAFPPRAALLAAWRDYRGAARRHPLSRRSERPPLYSTPDEAESFAGLPPTVLAVGGLDPVADDVRALARRLRAAGNTVDLGEFDDLPHGTFLTDPGLRRWLGTAYTRRAA
ncbi:alpha/beta hydrolase fold domain-containing protein [Kitasatospora cinereorecta]|uniref:alpha/beta hydrolase fold domain-containing protein n=1 Tax=Kitasatospora cinereorecta TaxID=285560 RepID=UPI0031F9ED06